MIRLISFLLIAAFALTTVGQTPAVPSELQAEREKRQKESDERVIELLDRTIAEGGGLRLSNNRAVVFALAGDLYWKFDQKRSRELFRGVGAELNNYNAEVERERLETTDALQALELFDVNDVRHQVLPIIGIRDAELALELLLQTRSAAMVEMIARSGSPPAADDSTPLAASLESTRVSSELQLEQTLAARVAESNVDAAIKAIRESMAKGAIANLIPALQKIHEKDEKKAADVAGEILKKLTDEAVLSNQNASRVALSYLEYGIRTPNPNPRAKPFVLPESAVKDLALKFIAVMLQPSRSMAAATFLVRAMPTLERLVPERAALLRQRAAENQRTMPAEFRTSQNWVKQFDPATTPEQILAEIAKIRDPASRREFYNALTSRIMQLTDDTRARRLIDQIPDEGFRTNIRNQFEATRIARMASTGSVEDTRRLIAGLTDRTMQVQRLVALALQRHTMGGTANVESTGSLMADARLIAGEAPENEDDMARLMEVVKGYATVEPETAFKLFEIAVGEFDVTVQASAVLSKFNKRDRTFRKGELAMRPTGNPGSLLPFRYVGQFQMLGKADLERMSTLVDRFTRSDLRTVLRLYVLQGFLREERKPAPPRPVPPPATRAQ